ncbi:serine hydrolase domain-containing protein [Luteimonas aquatica]|uniref:serine hydrolase domain-containing protein n=1 Tax=Luteimonas aquatica TaxID=450364 RepID=UPI001F5AAAE2|nr:serine hydrolase domain-containing protein [Luteimonas aquatica]
MRPSSLLLLLAAALGGCASPGPDASSMQCPDALMRDYAGDGPGAAVLVLRDGAPLARCGYGLADLETRTPVTPQTNFRLASVTKQFTAAAILLLAEDGKLGLDDPLRKWLPSLPAAADAITLRHLLTHTSGLIDYEDVMAPDAREQVHDSDVLRLLETQDRLYFAPGTGYRYSNSGYALLALIVGKASGQDFAAFLRARIFRPLGMDGSVAYEQGISSVARRAYGYTLTDGAWQRTDQSSTSAVLGDGGIYSSIDDLAKWDAALYDDRLLSAASRRLAFTAHTRTDEPDVDGYGYGWRIHGETLWHSGETVGFRNVIVRWPQRHLTVVVLTNRNDPEPYRLALRIAARYLPSSPPHS